MPRPGARANSTAFPSCPSLAVLIWKILNRLKTCLEVMNLDISALGELIPLP